MCNGCSRPARGLRSREMKTVFLCALAIMLPTCVGGCSGYTTATTFGVPVDAAHGGESVEVRSVEVPIFANETLYTGLEREVTDAVIKELQARTPWRVTGNGSADTTLTGRIVGVEKTRLANQKGSGLAQDIILSVTIDFEWKDARTGHVLVARQSFRCGDWYTPSRPVGERPDLAEAGVAAEVARDIVSTLRTDF